MIIVAIDPSVNNIGIAIYDTASTKLKTRLLHPHKQYNLVQKASQLKMYLISVLPYLRNPDVIIIEYPEFQGSTKGKIAAQQGYTLDLAFLVGYILGGFSIPQNSKLMPTPNEWKGQTPKKATEERVKRMFGDLSISEHEFDACGMILWYLTKL